MAERGGTSAGLSKEDLAEIDRRLAEWEGLDKDLLNRLQAEYHLNPPQPYAALFDALTPDEASFHSVAVAIANDPELSPEQRYALGHELSDRHRQVVIAQAGQGFND